VQLRPVQRGPFRQHVCDGSVLASKPHAFTKHAIGGSLDGITEGEPEGLLNGDTGERGSGRSID